MSKKLLGAAVALTAGVAAAVVAATPAGANAGPPEYVGWSGGTLVTAVGGLVTSNYTAPSAISTPTVGLSTSNTTANVQIPNLASVPAVSTSETTKAIPGGTELVSNAKVTNLSLLGGLITADVIDTTAIAQITTGGVASGSGNTTFVNLHIAGVTVPVNPAKNFGVTIPGIATVLINGAYQVPGSQAGTINSDASGLYVSLLHQEGSDPVGTQIWVTPAHAGLMIGVANNITPAGGFAYATKIDAAVSNLVGIDSGPTAFSSVPATGTNGTTITNSTAALSLPNIVFAGAVATTMNANATPAETSVTTGVETTGVNLLGGLITADVLKGSATADQLSGKPVALSVSTSLVNLKIAGTLIPINVSPNTVINIAGIAKVTINEQVEFQNIAAIRMLDITLTTAGFGLPAGAEIEVGAAAAWVGNL